MGKVFPIVNVLGMVIMLFSTAMLLPLGISMWYGDAAEKAFLVGIGVTFVSGLFLWLATERFKRDLKARDGFLLVVMIWAGLTAFAAIPLLLSVENLSFTDAYFESMSGFTTTGATVLSGLDALPPSVNVWRTELHWIGGMGIIVLAVAILPLLGVGGMQMYKAETPGPMKDNKLTPRITETAKGLWLVYVGLTAACLLALRVAGMSWLDALIHSFSTLGTGGFSSHDASIGYYHSPLIEGVLMVFMLLAGLNFSTHFLVLRRKSFAPFRSDPEVKVYLAVVLLSSVALAFYLRLQGVYPDFWVALRYAAFNTVSIATTTGFATTNYGVWPVFAPLWMLFLGMFCTSSGSTGGGIKMVRAQLLFKQGFREMNKLIHPRGQLPVKLASQIVPNQIVFAVLAFMFLYLACLVALTFVLLLSGMDFISALTAVLACMNTIGPGLNQIGPASTYAGLSDFQTWVCTFSMLLGRLEVFTLLVVLTPSFWRK